MPELVDHFYAIVIGGKPLAGARWSLADIDRIDVGRGTPHDAYRLGRTLRVDIPDRWMSSTHVRFDRAGAQWTVADAGSRNGVLVNGQKHEHTAITDRDIIETGRSFFALRTGERAGAPMVAPVPKPGQLVTLDPALEHELAGLLRATRSELPILFRGPTGAGKARAAQFVHARSGRIGAFIAVDCGALPGELVESALFGYKKGAIAGAITNAPGIIAAASGGTLFLDEIGALAPHAQAALLHALETSEVVALGATAARPVDLQVVAATSRDVDAMVANGELRADLLARLTGFSIALPALADRRVDLGLILGELLAETAQMTATFVRALFAYGWPRNVRELAQTVDHAVSVADGGELTPAHLPPAIAGAPSR